MSKMIQLRNVPDALHRRLKMRAVESDRSLSDYLIAELRKVAQRPSMDELRARLVRRKPVALSEPPAQALRNERNER